MSKKSTGPLKCEDVQPLLTDYMNRELGPYKSDAVREHLRKCDSCSAAVKELDLAVNLLKSVPKADNENIPKRLSPRSRRRITMAYKHPFLSWLDSNQIYIVLMTLVLLMLGMIAFFLDARQDEGPDFEEAIEINLGPPGLYGNPEVSELPDNIEVPPEVAEEMAKQKESEGLSPATWLFVALLVAIVIGAATTMRAKTKPVDINDKEPELPPGSDDGPTKSD